jgi:hypothetical protein
MTEVWKAVPGYEGRYEVSDQGRVKVLAHAVLRKDTDKRKPYTLPEKILRQHTTPSGHKTVSIARTWVYVHRIVLLSFVGAASSYAAGRVEARHLNGDPEDNRLTNLAWGTVKENRADRRRLGERVKLTRAQAQALCTAIAQGLLLKDAAAKHGIGRHAARRYRNGYIYG